MVCFWKIEEDEQCTICIDQRKKKDDEGIFVHSHAILLIYWRGSH